jgi:hypothetical protein
MKFLITLLPIFLISFNSFSQSMAQIFRLLPDEYSLDLNSKQKDTLLRDEEYILPGGDSIETVQFELSLNEEIGYGRFGFRFTTGQNGFVSVELRKFKENDGSILIVYSRVGGMLGAFDQQDVLFFKYKNSKLILSNEKLLPQSIPVKNFLKKGTPDTIAKKIENYVMATYDLDPENPASVSYNLFPGAPLDDLEKYVLGYSMIFTWTGKSFIKKLNLDNKQ